MSAIGRVSIVGAGPGDPDLITIKGLELLRRADVVLHDRLVSPDLLRHARADALIVDVGKRLGQEEQGQREIHRLMIEHARAGKHVCRLQGGDPMVFGRAGEEMAELTAAGVPYEIISGVTSVTAAAAAAGISLTRRDRAHGFIVVAASRLMSFGTPEWKAATSMAIAGGTVVVLMGLARLEMIAQHLLKSGCSPDTPALVVSRATDTAEQTRSGPLSQIARLASGLETPALLIVGHVTAMNNDPPNSI
jgi:uroporphyrin-III C-methyltransferase/precorrin-2 dehydrogenase/sirohydrochlorin ferrochelatase